MRRFGLHAMVASDENDPLYFADTVRMLFETVDELSAQLGGIEFEVINMGGGIGIPYQLRIAIAVERGYFHRVKVTTFQSQGAAESHRHFENNS